MAKGPKGFTEDDKIELRQRLCAACEQSWATHGYKKTTVGELSKSIGIATGSFYLLFASKEELFYETLIRIQDRLRETWQSNLAHNPSKNGFQQNMMWLYGEYYQYPFLYDFTNPDFMSLLNRFTPEQKATLQTDSLSFFAYTVETAGLKLKIQKQKAFAVLGTLLYTVSFKKNTEYNHFEVFEFLLESAIQNIFE